MSTKSSDWDLVITPHRGWLELHLDGIWQYRDLLWIFIKRNIVTQYKQTILGPFWLFIQPVITTIVFTVIFGNLALSLYSYYFAGSRTPSLLQGVKIKSNSYVFCVRKIQHTRNEVLFYSEL